MKRKIFFVTVILFYSHFAIAQETQKSQKVNKKANQLKSSSEKENLKDSVVFNSNDLGGVWSLDKSKDQLVYDPDSRRQTSIYTKYLFSVSEFKNARGDLNSKSNLTIFYMITSTDKKNYIPKDSNLPSPSGGFTYITHICKIIKIEAN